MPLAASAAFLLFSLLQVRLERMPAARVSTVNSLREARMLRRFWTRAKLIFLSIQISINFDDQFFLIYLRTKVLRINLKVEHCEAFYMIRIWKK
jgi:hypothetical protein